MRKSAEEHARASNDRVATRQYPLSLSATRGIVVHMKPVDITNPPLWDLLWDSAAVPPAERNEWREVMAYRTKLPDEAEVLAGYGWTPAEVVAARTDPTVYSPDLYKPWYERMDADPAVDCDGGRRWAALMVLAEETARYHDSRARLAREIRTQYMLDLAQRLPKEQRWAHEVIGLALSLTKQRVQQILRPGRSRPADLPASVVPEPGVEGIEVAAVERRRRLTRLFGD